MNTSPPEKALWESVKDMMELRTIRLGTHWSYNLWNDPKRLAFVLSRYKFAAKMACCNAAVLELGCSEGIGTSILAEFATSYTGIDMDSAAIQSANANWGSAKSSFIEDDFLGRQYGTFDAVISLDVIEHIQQSSEELFFKTVTDNLSTEGTAIIGTPNITSEQYASDASRAGHVNLFSGERLQKIMERHFRAVLMFGMNDEIVHTGFFPMCHYLMCIGIGRIQT